MTQAVCIVCGASKVGAWTECRSCEFEPRTGIELVSSLAYSDQGRYKSVLNTLPGLISQQIAGLDGSGGAVSIDLSLIQEAIDWIRNPSHRDPLTLRRGAKDGIFEKQLNVHEVGPDGYRSDVLTRGKDIDPAAFDAVRSSPDRELFVLLVYEHGQEQRQSVSKQQWYALHDLMLLQERRMKERSKLQRIYEECCQEMSEDFLYQKGVFFT